VCANPRIAALVALKTRLPVVETLEALSTIDPPGRSNGSAFCTVNSSPLTWVQCRHKRVNLAFMDGCRLLCGLTCDLEGFLRTGVLVPLSCGDNLASKLQPERLDDTVSIVRVTCTNGSPALALGPVLERLLFGR
jgi:hypothetical protein